MASERDGFRSAVQGLDFLHDAPSAVDVARERYTVLIADDDREVHTITKMILKSFVFEEKGLIFLDTYSGQETMEVLAKHPNTAVLLLDVVMEENQAGLQVVKHLRDVLKNSSTRIILRTGQPGEAPEDRVIRDYDINDYRLKTDMTVQRLNTSMYAALRSYRDIVRLEKNRRGLERMIEASSDIFKHDNMSDFLTSILRQISSFHQDEPEMVFLRENKADGPGGFIASDDQKDFVIVAAKGRFEAFVGRHISEIPELASIYACMAGDCSESVRILPVENGFLVRQSGNKSIRNFIFVEGGQDVLKLDLIGLFLTNYSIALDSFHLDKVTKQTQEEMIFTLGEVIEAQFEETSGHLKRVTDLMQALARKAGLPEAECEFVRIASALHDVGKIGIPDAILKKTGKLTDEEFAQMKLHTVVGNRILGKSKMSVLQIAAELALHHHERFDGSGYPEGLVGDAIPLYSRMMALVDVFDAMTHKRVYKDAMSHEEASAYISGQKNRHFDPTLVDFFLEVVAELD
jgi:response regulator RpfG family c-di-GMP phosphodiesterase